MAEDDKYVPSEGNIQLDPTSPFADDDGNMFRRNLTFRLLAAEKELYDSNNERSRRKFQADKKARFEAEYETDPDGTVRTKGYWQTKGGQTTAKTRAARAHITERTWGKYNRGETMDMYGNRGAQPQYTAPQKPSSPPKKSNIITSMSPEYGKWRGGNLFGETLGADFAGIMGWIGRFPPNICGPVMVQTFANKGGYIQSNAQEANNVGRPINILSGW